jgi:hypothetical protein
MVKEQATLNMHIMKFHGYIVFINLTFIEIHKPQNNDVMYLL